MKLRSIKNATSRRDKRRADFDRVRDKKGYKRPGSLNPKKGG